MTINAKRLLKLADYLETVPRKQFNMQVWRDDEAECGFSGCAIGWAVHGKLFRGLSLQRDRVWGPFPRYQNQEDWDAVETLFAIPPEAAQGLFGPVARKTPHQVAKRIRKFVAANQVSK